MMKDVKKHILAGLGSSLLVSLPPYLSIEAPSGHDLFSGLWVCLWVGIIVGLVKEWCDNDYSFAGYFDWRDFLWTIAGAVVIALLIVGMHYGKG